MRISRSHVARMTPDSPGDDPSSFVGALREDGRLWGYLLVAPDRTPRRSLWTRIEVTFSEEVYRLAPPRADDPDEPGLSRTIVRDPGMQEELSRLRRCELRRNGRSLAIRWLKGAEAELIRTQYFPADEPARRWPRMAMARRAARQEPGG
jgi:hypothetical protein